MLALVGMCVVALLPIIWLVVALCGLHLEAWKASLGAFLVAIACSVIGWQMAPVNVVTAALEGFAMALWPISIVIIAAVFTYNVTVRTGAMDTIKRMLCSVSADKRVLVILIGWCFGNFLEGMAGFGTAVAIPASMLAALGVNPVTAIVACLLANGLPTMFGSIGIPTATLATITGLDPIALSTVQTLQALPFIVVTPLLMAVVVDGRRALKGIVPVALVASLSFGLAELVAARFIGAELPDIVGAVASLALTFAFCLRNRNAEVPEEYRLEVASSDEPMTAKTALLAWFPFIMIFVVLLLTSKLVPVISAPLSQFKSVVNIYAGDPNATLTFSWVNTPGVLILICGIVGAIVQGLSPREMGEVMAATCKQMSKTVVTMLCMLACAKIMGYSGMIASIAAFFVGALGGLYPLVAPLLGMLGTFVTGSGTSSEVLFGNVQLQAAQSMGVDPTWLVAANSLGTSAGKMLSPQSIAIGCAACSLQGKDGEILGKIAKFAFAYAALMSLLVLAGSMLGL